MMPPLTATEARVVGLVAKGHTNQEIAEVLALQPYSVEGNLLRACEKLGVRSRTELALMLTVNSDKASLPPG